VQKRPQLCLVTPALADANNGNWQTARRWARLLAGDYRVRLAAQWQPGDEPAQLLIALHARRSAASLAAWCAQPSPGPSVLVLTGTDVYRDIDTDPAAQRSLELATTLVVLQAEALNRLQPAHRAKAVVVLQSTPGRKPLIKTTRHVRALAVGHLRDEKNPRLYFDAAQRLQGSTGILMDHIGAPLDAALAAQAVALAGSSPHYRWLGPLPHGSTLRHIQRAHLLVHMSHMEGGAHVVMEAVRSGTPVLASRIDGNVGMLGRDYTGYFEPGDAQGLVALLKRCRGDSAFLAQLTEQCAQRSVLFTPKSERAALLATMRAAAIGT
jgi:putative glycosyltransferase (TIGR04348 family)